MSAWLRATGMSPGPTSDADNPVVIGPFESRERLDEFLAWHGRLFSSAVTVYSPDEYDDAAEEYGDDAAEGADT